MPESPADKTAEYLDGLHKHLVGMSADVLAPGDYTRAVGHVTVTVPAWFVQRLWNEFKTAARQLRTLASTTRWQADRIGTLESTNAAHLVELSTLRGTEPERLQELTRWAAEFAAEAGFAAADLPALVQAQAGHDNALWARLDRERMELEELRIQVWAILSQARDAGAEAKGLDARGASILLRALERAYRRSRA